ncbi:hypothetical protein TNCV_4058821 [Trichonephila clavipes]|nr:hypothetical protein TNCV_4058821 [Trichonephila clavipes]
MPMPNTINDSHLVEMQPSIEMVVSLPLKDPQHTNIESEIQQGISDVPQLSHPEPEVIPQHQFNDDLKDTKGDK